MEERESWGSKISFILACIGYAVGLGNIWRFPYLVYKSGGGAFFIPYVIMLIFCGIPLLYMELSMGQYTRRGPIGALGKMCPILKGAGLATVIMSFLLSTYYNVIMSWALFYFFSSFSSTLPWENCDNEWNSPNCWPIIKRGNQSITSHPILSSEKVTTTGKLNSTFSSTQEFYDHRVLGITKGIEEMGSIRGELFGLLLLAWVLVYFCIWKSVKATGKVVYFTATFPYVLLIVFTVRAVTLEGANQGIVFLFKPDWEEVMKPKVWVYAAAQVFNSIGIAFGSLIAFASYNKFDGPILKNTMIVVLVDAFTCILCGVCVFATLGNLAHIQGEGVTVKDVVANGPGLVFVAFPTALSQMPLPQFWSVIFFAMLVMLGIDSQFAIVEVVITSLKDGYGRQIDKYLKRHEILVLIVCIFSFLCGLPNIFEGGIYFYQLMDYYTAAISLMYIALAETVAVVWCYGANRLSANITEMTGYSPNWFFKVCWFVIAPLLLCVQVVFSMIDYSVPSYNNGQYVYPAWCIGLGWFIASLSLLPIIIVAIVTVIFTPGKTIFRKFLNSWSSVINTCPCCDTPLGAGYRVCGEHGKMSSKYLETTTGITPL